MWFAEGVLLEGSAEVCSPLEQRVGRGGRRDPSVEQHCQVALGLGRTLCEAGRALYIVAKMCFLSSELPGSYFHAACAK